MDQRDQELASHIRDKVRQLRHAIEDAQAAGLSVDVPELAHLYLAHGTATGSPSDWKIARELL